MSRKHNTGPSSTRSLMENLEGRQLFAAFAGADWNGDGLVTGDDYSAIDAGDVNNAQAEYAKIDQALSMQDHLSSSGGAASINSSVVKVSA